MQAVVYPILAVASALAVAGLRAAETRQPLWAYGYIEVAKPGEKATFAPVPPAVVRPGENEAEMRRPLQVPGSAQRFSRLELRGNLQAVRDWFPEDHPRMTPVIEFGPATLKEHRRACGSCHMPHGLGRPENAPLAGLPRAYFLRQLADMRSGARTSAEPRKSNALVMVMLAQAMTEAEMAEAADYFAALKHTPWIRVEETERVPRVASEAGRWVALAHERTEPIGGRIIELAEDEEQFKLLNPRSGFVALVPPGSLKRGEWLVTTGGVGARDGVAKTLACTTCHGPDLLGNDEIPPIAGRSPSYLARQMFDFQAGARRGVAAATMAPVVANLDADDVTAIVAYVSSLPAARR